MYEDRLYENAKEKYNSTAKVLKAAYTAKASDHGKIFFLNAATEFEVKLPAPSLGLAMSFIVKAAPSGANYTIVTHDMTGLIKGGVYSCDLNATNDADFETYDFAIPLSSTISFAVSYFGLLLRKRSISTSTLFIEYLSATSIIIFEYNFPNMLADTNISVVLLIINLLN